MIPLRDGLATASNRHLAAKLHSIADASSNALCSVRPEVNNKP